ncbi:hypothetical protein GCM10012275_20210 [Longimycelium tulufanense]|uniref:DUF3830 domain-containing protein n=1 Tax=Longimycelium tulufanense TaxID=907463 RepID=A0A8J3FV62_9PSEU|nr:DUF3830 family protein [Longimycelium tulufanense]GGM49324.1 hypothetical protein GCM10012275_20210 [Longimycelium tulufanense]
MPRHVTITLEHRGVSCVAELLDKDAPRTCTAVWEALPLAGDAFHAKYARHEVYTMVPGFGEYEVGLENSTVTPIPGDVVYFSFPDGTLDRRFKEERGIAALPGVVDLAIFYGRNNLLLNGDVGWVPGNVFATVVDGLSRMAEACHDVWRSGSVGERLVFQRFES